MNKPSFHVGDRVTWENGRFRGTVIGNDWIESSCDGGYWRVTAQQEGMDFDAYTSADESHFCDDPMATYQFPQYLKGG